jgi:branched-chain amino acid transport system permease protein
MLIAQQLVNALTLSGVYALVAVSFTLGIGILNFLNFTIQATFMLAGMVIWALVRAGLPWPVAAACGIVMAAVVQLVVERFTYRYFSSKHSDATEHALPLVSSLGFLIIFQNLALILWGSDPQTLTSPFGDTNLRLGGLVVSLPQFASLLIAILFVVIIKVVLERSSLGRGLRCIAENPTAASLMGIEVHRLVPIVFATAGFVAGVAGILFAVSYLQVSPRIGDEIGTKAIAAMVIGGMGNIWGAIAGGLLVGAIEVLSINYFDAEKVNAIVWGSLLLVLCVRPSGLFGRVAFGKGKL